jgi:phenylacetate-CoA ligase
LLKVPGLAPQYLIFVDRSRDQLDKLEVWVEAAQDLWGQGKFFVAEMERKANREVYEMLGVHTSVLVVEPHKLERSLGKAVRVMDKRTLKA